MNDKNLPSLVSATRLIFAALIYYLVHYYFLGAALVLFLLGLFTDWLDGRVARALKAETQFGAFWDTLCDKVLIIVSLLAIRYNIAQPWSFYEWRFWHFLYVIIAIEITLVLVRPLLYWFGRDIKAGIFGKVKMATLGCLVAVLFAAGIIDTHFLNPLIIGLIALAVLFGIMSIAEKIVRIF